MKNIVLISIISLFILSCGKVTEKNIRGNWEVTKQTLNGQDVTVNDYRCVWTFNQSPDCIFSLDWSPSPLVHTYNLDKDAQKLTIGNFITEVSIDTTITLFYLPSVTFDVEKNGKTMTLRSPGDTIVCELTLIPPEY